MKKVKLLFGITDFEGELNLLMRAKRYFMKKKFRNIAK